MAIGVSVLGERLTPAMLGAFVLILGGSVLATRPGQHSRPSPMPHPRPPPAAVDGEYRQVARVSSYSLYRDSSGVRVDPIHVRNGTET